jgi:hypothetical protein
MASGRPPRARTCSLGGHLSTPGYRIAAVHLQTAVVTTGDDWAARRGDAAAEQVARLDRVRAGETEQARALLAGFVRDASERGLPTVRLKARATNGRAVYRTGLTGWYLKRNGSLAVDENARFYVLTAPPSLASRLRGAHVPPSDPPLVVGVGGRDGESLPLAELLALRLDSGETWDR